MKRKEIIMKRNKQFLFFLIFMTVGFNVVMSDNIEPIALSIPDHDDEFTTVTSSLLSYHQVRRSKTVAIDTPIEKVRTIGTTGMSESASCITIDSKNDDDGSSGMFHEYTEYHDASDLSVEKTYVEKEETHLFQHQREVNKQLNAKLYDYHFYRLRRNIQYLYSSMVATSEITLGKGTKSGLTALHDKYLEEMVHIMISNQTNEIYHTNDYYDEHENHDHHHTHSHHNTDEHHDHDHHHHHHADSGDHHHFHHHHRHLASSVTTNEAGGMIEDPSNIGNNEDGGDECYFKSPNRLEMEKDVQLMRIWKLIEDLSSIADGGGANTNEIRYVIPTYYHILLNSTDPLNDMDTTNERVTQYIQYLNQAFENSFVNSGITTKRFEFVLQGITRTINTAWSTNCIVEEFNYKSQLKVMGPYPDAAAGVFNIYQCRSIYDPIRNAAYNGFSSFPGPTSNSNIKDGVVLSRSNVGVSRLSTLVHETGHFLGLYHTFSSSCNLAIARNGDFVDDTPYHLENATKVNCKTDPSTWDTCPDLPGQDPVDNYMTYSIDNACRTKFTPGQVARIIAQFELYRFDAHIHLPTTQKPTSPPTFVPVTPAPVTSLPTFVPITISPVTPTPTSTPVTSAPVTPTSTPVTPAPVTLSPTFVPVTPAPVTSQPTFVPVTSAPVTSPTTFVPVTPAPLTLTAGPVINTDGPVVEISPTTLAPKCFFFLSRCRSNIDCCSRRCLLSKRCFISFFRRKFS